MIRRKTNLLTSKSAYIMCAGDSHHPGTLFKYMTPTLNRVLVTPPVAEDVDQKSTGGLFIPQQAREASKFVQGTVLAVGPDVKQVKAKDVVLYRRDQGNEISEDSKVVAVLIEDKHIAVVL